MASRAKTLAKGSIFQTTYFFISICVGLFLMPFIIRSLGDNAYGLWALVGSFIGFYWLFDLGLSSAVTRFISKSLGSSDYEEASKTATTSFLIFSILGLLVFFVGVLISYIGPLFIRQLTDVSLFRQVIIITSIGFALSFPLRVFPGILQAHLRFDLNTIIDFIKLIVRTVLIVVFLGRGFGLLALVVITTSVDILAYLLRAVYAKIIARNITISRTFIDYARVKILFNYSGFSFLSRIADKLRFGIDNFVIAAFIGLNAVTIYSIASRLIHIFSNLVTAVIGVLVPVFSQYEGAGDFTSIRKKFILMTKISSYLAIFIGGSLLMFGKAFIERWVGPQYTESYPLLIVLLIPCTVALMQNPSIQLLYGISKHNFYAISNSIEAIANLVLSLILVRKFGLLGVAFGTAIPMIITKLFVQPLYICKLINIDISSYYFKILGLGLLKSLTILALFWWICKGFITSSYFSISILMCCEAIFFAVFVFIAGFKHVEKNYFKNVIRSKVSSL